MRNLLLMNTADLENRTKASVLRVIRFVSALQRTNISDTSGRQLLRSGASIGANYREANRAESRNDFLHKIGIVEKGAADAN
jgi:four helix bundle protein